MAATVDRVIAYCLHSQAGGAIDDQRSQQIDEGRMALAEGNDNPALGVSGHIRLLLQPDERQVLGVNLEAIAGIDRGDRQGQKAQLWGFQALEKNEWPSRRIFERQEAAAVSEAGQARGEGDCGRRLKRDASKVASFTFWHGFVWCEAMTFLVYRSRREPGQAR